MLISYVIPVYNMENYIRQCINSIFAQVMFDDEIELIIINDASTDDSLERIEDALDDRFRGKHWPSVIGYTLINHLKNRGAGYSLYEGFQYANGDYVCYLSADDVIIDIMKTHNQLNHMIKYNADLSYCNTWYAGPTTFPKQHIVKSSFIFTYDYFNKFILDNNYLTYFFLNFKNPINSSTFMISRSAIAKYGQWNPNIKSDCDGDLLLRYSLYGAKIIEVNSKLPYIYYRLHENQLSNNLSYMTETMKYNRRAYKDEVLSGDYPYWLKLLVKLFVGV